MGATVAGVGSVEVGRELEFFGGAVRVEIDHGGFQLSATAL